MGASLHGIRRHDTSGSRFVSVPVPRSGARANSPSAAQEAHRVGGGTATPYRGKEREKYRDIWREAMKSTDEEIKMISSHG